MSYARISIILVLFLGGGSCDSNDQGLLTEELLAPQASCLFSTAERSFCAEYINHSEDALQKLHQVCGVSSLPGHWRAGQGCPAEFIGKRSCIQKQGERVVVQYGDAIAVDNCVGDFHLANIAQQLTAQCTYQENALSYCREYTDYNVRLLESLESKCLGDWEVGRGCSDHFSAYSHHRCVRIGRGGVGQSTVYIPGQQNFLVYQLQCHERGGDFFPAESHSMLANQLGSGSCAVSIPGGEPYCTQLVSAPEELLESLKLGCEGTWLNRACDVSYHGLSQCRIHSSEGMVQSNFGGSQTQEDCDAQRGTFVPPRTQTLEERQFTGRCLEKRIALERCTEYLGWVPPWKSQVKKAFACAKEEWLSGVRCESYFYGHDKCVLSHAQGKVIRYEHGQKEGSCVKQGGSFFPGTSLSLYLDHNHVSSTVDAACTTLQGDYSYCAEYRHVPSELIGSWQQMCQGTWSLGSACAAPFHHYAACVRQGESGYGSEEIIYQQGLDRQMCETSGGEFQEGLGATSL
ncbi:MAG: hypothetical protein OXT67_04765 [Zetaproteobacteria bacterium]|nr:hypothetical protein [Zetaproteobacteria bacterium]